MKKKLFLIIFIFLLTGCYNYKELNKIAIVSSISIDKKDNEYLVGAQVMNIKTKDDTKYKIMCSKMCISWTDGMCYSPPNNIPHVEFSLCNIAEFSVFGFCPMSSALPPEFKQ